MGAACERLRALTAALGLRLRRHWLVRVLQLVADDRLHGAERERWTLLATDGESDGAEGHDVLLIAETGYTPDVVVLSLLRTCRGAMGIAGG